MTRRSMNSVSASRRRFLQGAGAAIALPFMPSLVKAASEEAAKAPIRTAFIYFPNGVWEKAWVPEKQGSDFELPESLKPLEAVRSEVLVLSGLDKKNSHGGDGHYAKTANFLTACRWRRRPERISAAVVSQSIN